MGERSVTRNVSHALQQATLAQRWGWAQEMASCRNDAEEAHLKHLQYLRKFGSQNQRSGGTVMQWCQNEIDLTNIKIGICRHAIEEENGDDQTNLLHFSFLRFQQPVCDWPASIGAHEQCMRSCTHFIGFQANHYPGEDFMSCALRLQDASHELEDCEKDRLIRTILRAFLQQS